MFIVYHSNNLEVHKDILLDLLTRQPLSDPFRQEVILVQSPGMAQWLQLQIAEKLGVAANISFPMPASFIWQQYANNLPNVSQQNHFDKSEMVWHLMNLLKRSEFQPHFKSFEVSAQSEQLKDYQLARKISDLFDQYLVYRPDWIMAWERHEDHAIERQIVSQLKSTQTTLYARIKEDMTWQGALWRRLTEEIRSINSATDEQPLQHRAHLHQQYLQKLQKEKPEKLPERLFIFGISALPQTYLDTFNAMSKYCDIHLFFNNPSCYYWGDIVDPVYLQQLQMSRRTVYNQQQVASLFSEEQLQQLQQSRFELTQEEEKLQIGHPLLASWGKLGRDFFYLLEQGDTQDIQAYVELSEASLLSQVQNRILYLTPSGGKALQWKDNDNSLSLHSCHSAMREVEVLHDYLLDLFQQNEKLTPKDVVVMVADINQYAPYIQAVFRRYEDNRFIPFSIADSKLSESDVLLAAFLSLLALRDSRFTAEEILALLDIPAIRTRFEIELTELEHLRHWVAESGIRFGLMKAQPQQPNYNAWQAGLERMLLGYAMREENGIWQDSLGLDDSYGLKGRLAGALAEFIDKLAQWQAVLQQSYLIEQWQEHLTRLVDDFFIADEHTEETLFYIKNSILELATQLQKIPFTQPLTVDVITEIMTEKLDVGDNGMRFLVGKVSFCTLLPMRSIPFKVVCLLGMNDSDYPRKQTRNSFDLMQYHRRKGDRSRRDDDRYLFLEALLAAQDYLYISYIGRSIIDNQKQEPSVLVSQLLDYLQDNLAESQRDKPLVKQHAMTIFSAQNFSESHRTFAKEWLPLTDNRQTCPADFIQPPIKTEREDDIELSRLIRFVQHPVRFFFEQRLGVFFRAEDALIAETENFTLNPLERYQIKQRLLDSDKAEQEHFFTHLTVKGRLPRAEFGRLYEHSLRSEIEGVLAVIEEHRQQPSDRRFIELPLSVSSGNILLYGHIDSLFGEEEQRIVWRAGRNTEAYLIENWLYYLVQIASQNNVTPPLCYAIEDKGPESYSFKTVDKTTALELLRHYVEAYLQSAGRLLPIPTANLANYLKLIKQGVEDEERYLAHITKSAYADKYTPGDIYWQRVLAQTASFDWNTINQTVQTWFEQMLESVIKQN